MSLISDERVEELLEKEKQFDSTMQRIFRISQPGTRTLDDFIRDIGWINDEARRWLACDPVPGRKTG